MRRTDGASSIVDVHNARHYSTYTPGDEGVYAWNGEVVKGTVWGSGPYTAHSHIVLAALHCGAVERSGKSGEPQYFRVSRVERPVLLYAESEHYGVISKPCGYFREGAIAVEEVGNVVSARVRTVQHFITEHVEPLLPDVGVDLLFECVSMALPSPSPAAGPVQGSENGRQAHGATTVPKGATACLCYVDVRRMEKLLDNVAGHPDEETVEFQSWHGFMQRVYKLLLEEEQESAAVTVNSGDVAFPRQHRSSVFLFRLVWAPSAASKTQTTIDVQEDVRIERAARMDHARLLLTFVVGMVLAFVPIVDVVSDMAATAQFWIEGSTVWLWVSIAILANSARFVTAFHVVDPEPNWWNLLITMVPLAHVVRLPFISDVEVKEKDKTQTIQKTFSSETVERRLLVDCTAKEAPGVGPNLAASADCIQALFGQMSLPPNFYNMDDVPGTLMDDEDQGDGEAVMPFSPPSVDEDHLVAEHWSGVERSNVAPLLLDVGDDTAAFGAAAIGDGDLPDQALARHASLPFASSEPISGRGGGHPMKKYVVRRRTGDGGKFRLRRKSVVPTEMQHTAFRMDDPLSASPKNALAASLRRSNRTQQAPTYQDNILLPLRKVYNSYVEEHSSRLWLRPVVGLLFELFLLLISIPVSIYVLGSNAFEVTYALLQQRFLGRGEDEPDDIIQRRKHQGIVISFAEAVSETLPQLVIQTRAYLVGALNPLLFFVSGSITVLSVLKNIATFILQFEDILQLSDSQKILQRSLANNPRQPDVWMTLGRYDAAVVLGRDFSPAACNMEGAYHWLRVFLDLHGKHKDDADAHVVLRGHRYDKLQCFVNAVKGWCRAMALLPTYGSPFPSEGCAKYRLLMARGWFEIASTQAEAMLPYVDGAWFTTKQCYELSIELDDTNPSAWMGLAACGGGFVDGVACDTSMCLVEAIHADGTLGEAFYLLAMEMVVPGERVTLNDKRSLSKLQCLEEAVRRMPGHAPSYLELGTTLPRDGVAQLDGDKSLNKQGCLLACVRLDPRCGSAFFYLGQLLCEEGFDASCTIEGRPWRARECFVRALAEDAALTAAYYPLGMELGHNETVVVGEERIHKKQCFATAIALGDDAPKVYYALAEEMEDDERIPLRRAEAAANKTSRRRGTTSQEEASLSRLDCYVNSVSATNDGHRNATALYAVAGLMEPDGLVRFPSLDAHRTLSQIDCLVEAIAANPVVAKYYDALGRALDRQGRDGVAMPDGRYLTPKECFLACVRLDRGTAEALYRLTECMSEHEVLDLGHGATSWGRAEMFAHLYELHYRPAECLVQLGLCLSRAEPGRHIALSSGVVLRSPQMCYIASIGLDGSVGSVFRLLAETVGPPPATVQLNGGRVVGALDCYQDLLLLDPQQPPQVLLTIGNLMSDSATLRVRGRHMTKKEFFVAAIDGDATCAEAYYNLSKLLGVDEVVSLPGKNGHKINRKDCLIEMIGLDYEVAEAYFALGELMGTDDSERTMLLDGDAITKSECYLEAVGHAPTMAVGYYALAMTLGNGSVLLPDGRRVNQRQCLLEALVHDPHMGNAFCALGKHMTAMETIKLPSPVDIGGGAPITTVNRVQCLVAGLTESPQLGEAYYTLANYLVLDETVELRGRRLNKRECMMEAVSIGGGSGAKAYLALARTLSQEYHANGTDGHATVLLPNGRSMSIKDCLLEAVSMDPHSSDAMYELGRVLGSHASTDQITIRLLDGTVLSQKDCFLRSIDFDPHNGAAYSALCELLDEGEVVTLRGGQRMTKRDALIEAVALNPTDEAAMRNMAEWMGDELRLKSGEILTRADCYVLIIAVNNSDPTIFVELGAALLKTRKPDVRLKDERLLTPLDCFVEALRIAPAGHPSIVDALLALGDVMGDSQIIAKVENKHVVLKKLTKRGCFTEAIAIQPRHAQAYALLAKTLSDLRDPVTLKDGRSITQRQCCLDAIALDSGCATAFYVLGTSLKAEDPPMVLKDGRKLRQLDCLREAVHLNHRYTEAYVALGRLLLPNEGVLLAWSNRLLQREECFLEALDIDPYSADAYMELGCCMTSETVTVNDRNVTRFNCFELSIALNPLNPFAYYHLGVALERRDARRAATAAPVPIKLKDGRRMTKQDCFVEALHLMSSSNIIMHSLYSCMYYHLGLSLVDDDATATLRDGRVITQRDCYLEAIARNPNYAEPYYALGSLACTNPSGTATTDVIKLKNGSLRTPRECVIRAAELKPDWAVPYTKLGSMLGSAESVQLNSGGKNGARSMTKRDCFVESIRLEPQYGEAYYQLGRVLGNGNTMRIGGKTLSNRECFVQAITFQPKHAMALYNLGCCLHDNETININGRSYTRSQLMNAKE